MEFVTLRAGNREGSAVYFATEQLLCVPVMTARGLGVEGLEHIEEPPSPKPAAPTGSRRLDILDSPSECPSPLGFVLVCVQPDICAPFRCGLFFLFCTEA